MISFTVALALAVDAWAAPTERQAEQYLEWYAAGEHERLWEAASEVYRTKYCLGDPQQCPVLPQTPLGERQRARMSCRDHQQTCTWTRTDRYDSPPYAYSEATVVDWIVTMDRDGRFQGVGILPHEPGAGAKTLGWLLGPPIGATISFVLVWAVLFGLVRIGGRRPGAAQ